MARKLRTSRHGLDEDPRGLHVTYQDSRLYLGEVVGGYYQSAGVAGLRLKVRHFNGEPWPFDPFPNQVTVLERSYDRCTDCGEDSIEGPSDDDPLCAPCAAARLERAHAGDLANYEDAREEFYQTR